MYLRFFLRRRFCRILRREVRNMAQGSELEKLEAFVKNLLTKYSDLKETKEALERGVAQRDTKISELQANIESLSSERGDVSSRVGSLLSQIEEWEDSLEDSGAEAVAEEQNDVADYLQEAQAELDAIEQDEEVDDSPESRQGSLFSVDAS